jgi:hypothetical protein
MNNTAVDSVVRESSRKTFVDRLLHNLDVVMLFVSTCFKRPNSCPDQYSKSTVLLTVNVAYLAIQRIDGDASYGLARQASYFSTMISIGSIIVGLLQRSIIPNVSNFIYPLVDAPITLLAAGSVFGTARCIDSRI